MTEYSISNSKLESFTVTKIAILTHFISKILKVLNNKLPNIEKQQNK